MSGASSGNTVKKTKAKRTLAPPKYKSFRLSKRIKHASVVYGKLPSSWQLLKGAVIVMRDQWLFFTITVVLYVLLSLIFVRGLSGGFDIEETKSLLNETLGIQVTGVIEGTALFGVLLGASTVAQDETASLYQAIVVIVFSMAIVWAIRQMYESPRKRVRVKESFYKGMQQLIPAGAVSVVIALELSLIVIITSILGIVSVNEIAVSGVEQLLWLLLGLLVVVLALYLLSSSIIAFYISTLPGMLPMKALRAASRLTLHRRIVVMRKLVMLPLFFIVGAAIVTIPTILLLPIVSEYVLLVLLALFLPLAHAYLYNLYQSLL